MHLFASKLTAICGILMTVHAISATTTVRSSNHNRPLKSQLLRREKQDAQHAAEPALHFLELGEFSEYATQEVLGEGGMGKVYKGYYKSTHTAEPVLAAIKVSTTTDVALVRKGTNLQKKLNNKNVLRAYNGGELDPNGELVTAIEFIDGADIWEQIVDGVYEEAHHADNGTNQLTSDFHQMVDGVAYCHSQGVFHRDLKPENFLRETSSGIVKVADFDTATTELDGHDSMCGTLPYLAPGKYTFSTKAGKFDFSHLPTIATDQIIDFQEHSIPWDNERGDVYAMGISLMFMVTGFFPWEVISPEAGELTELAEHLMYRCGNDDCRFDALKQTYDEFSDPALDLLSMVLTHAEDRIDMVDFKKTAETIEEFGSGKQHLHKRDYQFAQSRHAGPEICLVPPKSPDRKMLENIHDKWTGSNATKPQILTTKKASRRGRVRARRQ
ncbi:MAG: hypothetical protein Q9165_006559 [Trypethelium subeluteriae]